MVYTQPIISAALTMLGNLIKNQMGKYNHEKVEYTDFINKMFDKMDRSMNQLVDDMLTSLWAGFYVGENETAFLVYGGNQSNTVGFTWIAKSRLLGARRPAYKVGEPKNVRKIQLSETGELSTNEA